MINTMTPQETPDPRVPVDSVFLAFETALRGRDSAARVLSGLRDGLEWVDLTAEQLLSQVVRVSDHLAAMGVTPGDVICLQLPNWTEAVIYTYAASRIGAVVCPVTTIYRQRELSFILERTRCRVVVVPATYRGFDYAAMLTEIVPRLPDLIRVITVGPTVIPGMTSSRMLLDEPEAGAVPVAPVADTDLAVLAFTSGTTGESKGVMHSHASMHAAIDDFVEHAGFGRGLTSLVMSPFGHLTGFTWGILMPLRGGGNVVLLESWDAERALDLFGEYDITFTMGATPFLSDLLDAAGKRPEARFPGIFVCAGAPIPPRLIERAVEGYDSRIVSGWGMSEYPIGTSTNVDDDRVLASVSDGRPAGRAEVLIVDPDGQPVAMGEEGDVIIRGPGLFRGYYKRPDLNVQSLTPDGFLKTGDRARLIDGTGLMRICGRTKDLIIRGGENIPVLEIENLLLSHPAVREVALVPVPHDRLGETACACIVPEPGADGEITVSELGRFLGVHGVAKQFFPEALLLLEELPRTPSGKIQKFALRGRVTASEAALA